MCSCLGTSRKKSKAESERKGEWVQHHCPDVHGPTSLSRCSWQRQKCRTGREQPPLLPDSAHNHSLLRFCKFPSHFLQGSQGCAEAAALLPGRYWWEEKRISSMKWTPESAKEQSSSWHPHLCTPIQPQSVCGCCLSILPLQSTWLFKIRFNFINPYHDSASRCRLCA